MRNDYKAENVVRFIDDFIKKEEHFDSMFFEKLACMFTTVVLMCKIDAETTVVNLMRGLWEDIESNCDRDLTMEEFDEFYSLMTKRIVWEKYNEN